MPLTLDEAQAGWQAVLDEVELSMTRATFDTWLRGSRVTGVDGQCLLIITRQSYAVEWLQHRLLPSITSTLDRHMPGVTIRFVANGTEPQTPATPEAGSQAEEIAAGTETSPLADLLATTVTFISDPSERGGWHPTSRYATRFWQPLLGPVAWSVYNLVRSDDTRVQKTLWTPYLHYEVSYLARLAAPGRSGRGNRAAIVGRWRRRPVSPDTGEIVSEWYPGAFDLLATTCVARIRWHNGDGRWRRWEPGGLQERPERARCGHELSVVTWLPYLTPAEVAGLPDELQGKHQRYLRDRAFDVDEWRALPLPSLVGLDLNAPELTAALAAVTGAPAADIRQALSFFARPDVPNNRKSTRK